MNKDQLKEFLEEYTLQINTPEFCETDPVQYPRRYDSLQDREIAGFLTALISWGKRIMILRNADKMFEAMGDSPYDYIMSGGFDNDFSHTIHRTFNYEDFRFICTGLRSLYQDHASMEEVFIGKDLFCGIQDLRQIIIDANGAESHRATKHLSSPSKNSACKRIHMFLRWMVRNDGIVDLGCWQRLSPSSLYIPLDVHVGNISRQLQLLDRKQNDRKSVELLTDSLKEFDPVDPVKYDFALFGIGVSGLL